MNQLAILILILAVFTMVAAVADFGPVARVLDRIEEWLSR